MKFDHVLLMGHGGPRKPDEVMPFLQAMTAGKNISVERLNTAARNYEMIGGASPYHDEVMRFAEHLEISHKDAGVDLPVFIGMKYWHPFFEDVLPEIRAKGHRKGLGIALNAFPGAVAGVGYRESLEAAKTSPELSVLHYDFLNSWYDRKLFIEAQAEEVLKTFKTIPEKERRVTPIIFSFHSLPVRTGRNYSEEANTASALVAKELGHAKWSVVYQSRSASAEEPWLGPDICEEIGSLSRSGEKRVVVVPLGFLCDHVEILYDLDHRARHAVEKGGMEYLRARTVIGHPKITQLLTELIAAEG